jgi:flagellar hook-associated protein FlgK
MKITRVKMLDNGLKGLEIWFDKNEDRGGLTFTNSYHVKVRVPVNSYLRGAFHSLERDFAKLLGLTETVNFSTVLDVSYRKGEGVVLGGRVSVGSWGEYGAKTMFVGQDNEYPNYEKLEGFCSELIDLTNKWMVESTGINSKQMLMDFREFGKENMKLALADYDFDSMSPEDATAKAMELLEKQGAVIMMQDDAF